MLGFCPLVHNCICVRQLDIFIVNLIQKYNISRFVTAYMCMCKSLMNSTACRHDIQINTIRIQNAVIIEIRLYPAEGSMPRALDAPFALVDIVRCSKSWTTVDAGRCSQCSPTNGSLGRRRVPRAITTRKKTYVDEQSRIAPQKPNRRAPRARFSHERGFRRHLLSRYSVRAEVRDGEA